MQPGKLLCDRYRVEKALAAGGFGQTFLAVDTHLPSKPQVVVKLLKPAQNDPATLQIAQRLFNTEAETLERLGKDNDRIPSLYAYFELRGEFYLVQEYIDGTTLTDELQERKISESDTLAILHEILTGLTRVHSQNIIHRDLKPDNIIRRGIDRKLVLIDFGAVKQVRAATVTTPNPAISKTIGIGTEGYMPSEQGIGYPKTASDIYAVGAIAIQCLTGSQPHLLFDEDSLKIEWQHLRRVNPDLATVLNKMVEPDYRHRYITATEALKAIESLIPSRPIPPQAPPKPIPTPITSPVATTPAQTAPTPIRPKPPSRAIDRRNFFKWLGFGGVGVVSVLTLSQIGKNSSSDTPKSTSNNPEPLPSKSPSPTVTDRSIATNTPKLTKIQFTSVKLDRQGTIINRPSGSAETFIEDLGNGVDLTMVKIPAGKFLMGQTEAEKRELIKLYGDKVYKDCCSNESPQHQVNVSEFYLGQTLVTQEQWLAIMGNNPSNFKGYKLPVEQVSWLDAIDFCQKLSQKTGRTYRLPSEAEWEYACRAGTTSPFAFGETITPAVVNYNSNYPYRGAAKGESRGKTTPVGSFPPNLFGLYDMHGNLWEWCLDEWFDNYNGAPTDGSARGDLISDKNDFRPVRGGSWYHLASNCLSARRYTPGWLGVKDRVGFRVVCVPSRTL